MGFFSKTCAKTHLPIITIQKLGFDQFKNVTSLFPDGKVLTGEYDGYGRVGGVSVIDDNYTEKTWNAVKFVLSAHYNGESYKDLRKSGNELGQGYFMDDKFLIYCATVKRDGFKSYSQYKNAFMKYANWL